MIKFIIKITFIVISLMTVKVSAADLKQILQEIDKTRAPGDTFIFKVSVDVHNNGKESKQEFNVRVKNQIKSLVYYTYPVKDKGKIILADENNMWIYIPGTSRALRISQQQKLLGAASNVDVARVVFSVDYEPIELKDINIDGKNYYELSLKAISKTSSYRNVQVILKKEDYSLVRSNFFTISNIKAKTIEYSNFKEVLGRKMPLTLTITSDLEKNSKTILRFSDYVLEDTPIEYFQPSYLVNN